jgi:hypothetical protein
MTRNIRPGVWVLFGFIVLAPLVSYYYLKMGYDYRKEVLQELAPKAEIAPFHLSVDTSLKVTDEMLEGKVCVLSYVEDEKEEWDYLFALWDQYKAREELLMLSFAPAKQNCDHQAKTGQWEVHPLSEQAFQAFIQSAIKTDSIKIPAYGHILVDTAGIVRRTYPLADPQSKVKLIEHLAIVLPRTVNSDIIYDVPNSEE